MRCPYCSSLDNKVVDSRMGKEGESIRRRRECLKCEGRFTTYERVEEVLPSVIKKDGRREPLRPDEDPERAQEGLREAAHQRGVLEKTVDDIEKSLQEKGLKEIPSTVIGEEVMDRLHRLDEVAYVRFASVYRSFKDINEFMSELKDILGSKEMKDTKDVVAENANAEEKNKSLKRKLHPAPPPGFLNPVPNPMSDSIVDIAVNVSVNKTFHYRVPGKCRDVLFPDRACSCPSAAGASRGRSSVFPPRPMSPASSP